MTTKSVPPGSHSVQETRRRVMQRKPDVIEQRRALAALLLARNPEAERAVLGGLLIDPEQVSQWADFLTTNDFQEPANAALWEAIHGLAERGEPCDVVQVDAELTRRGTLRDVGQATVHEVANSCVSSTLVPHYAGLVVRNAEARRVYGVCSGGAGGSLTPAEVMAQLQVSQDRLVELERRIGGKAAGAFSLEELMAKALPELRWVVPQFIPEGLVLLGSKRKLGKSWLVYALVLAVGAGGRWLGQPVECGEALYLALEDGERRLQDRGRKLLAGQAAPSGITIQTDWPRLDTGGLRKLDGWLKAHPQARVVVIDVLAKVRPPHNKWADSYAEDYALMGSLKQLADRYHVAIVVVHHTRKAAATDVFDELNGSMGLSGAADTLLVLARARGEDEATLNVTARDAPEGQYALRFDKMTGAWQLLGDAGDVARTREQTAVLRVLREALPQSMTDQEVALALGYKPGQDYSGVRARLGRMTADGAITSPERGHYTVPPKKHESQATQRHNVTAPTLPDCDVVTPVMPVSEAQNGYHGPPPANCRKPDHHQQWWRDLAGLGGWVCIAHACQAEGTHNAA